MKQYSEEFKASIIAEMLAPNNVGVPQLARETGIPKDTLYPWRIKHLKSNGDAMAGQVPSGVLSSEAKFAVLIETASLNEVELGEYGRRKGLYPQQLSTWREACLQANGAAPSKLNREKLRQQGKLIRSHSLQSPPDAGRKRGDRTIGTRRWRRASRYSAATVQLTSRG